MQRFLISVALATIISWIVLLIFASKTTQANLLKDLIFTVLLFIASSLTLSLILYFTRVLILKLIRRGKIKFEEENFVDLRPVFRRSFKMAAVICAFITILAFLKLEDLLNLFNFALLLAIIVLGAIWLRR